MDIRELARLITGIESKDAGALKKLAKMTALPNQVIGVTGPPGAGKSTIVDRMITRLRKAGHKVGVVAIDPSSPFSGGALLGDRIRMQEHSADKGVFIRSVGSRGSHGGLSRATRDIVRAMASAGFDHIIVETVGVGQTELGIMEIADVTIVVLVPESGDMIQTMKAGILEIADVFVVNKADRPGSDQMKAWLGTMFERGAPMDAETNLHHGFQKMSVGGCAPKNETMAHHGNSEIRKFANSGNQKNIPILLTRANTGEGIDELMKAVAAAFAFVKKDAGRKKKRAQMLRQEFFDLCADEFRGRLVAAVEADKEMKKTVEEIEKGKKNPYEGLQLLGKFVKI